MIQQRRNSRRFVLSELRTFGKSPADDNGGGGGGVGDSESATASASVADVDSDDADDGFCIQLEPMAPLMSLPPPSKRMPLADLSSSSSVHDDRPPSKHEIAQWKSIINLKSGIT